MARSAYHHGDLPAAAMDAALADLTTGDRFALNFNQIAKRLGVTHAALYRHFPTKQHLVDALATRGFHGLREAFEQALAEPPHALPGTSSTTRERIGRLARSYVRYCLENPALVRLMFSGAAADREREPALQQAAFGAISMLQELVEQASREGWITPDEVYDVTRLFWAGMHGLATLRIEGQFDLMLRNDAEFDALVERSARWLLRGVVPEGVDADQIT